MAMGKRTQEQTPLWVAISDLPVSPGHPFYRQLNAALDGHGFDAFVEAECASFYAPVMGRPGLPPGRYFRLLLIGYFEGIDSERGIAWRAADSLAVRSFLRLGLEDVAPDHSTISRTRRLIDLETHRAVFRWVQQRLVTAGLLKGRTIAIDATTLEATAAMRSIVRRDTGESYQAFLTRLVHAYPNILKRLLIHAGGFNLGLLIRAIVGVGTPRELQGRLAVISASVWALVSAAGCRLAAIGASDGTHGAIPGVTLPTTLVVNSSAAATCTTGC